MKARTNFALYHQAPYERVNLAHKETGPGTPQPPSRTPRTGTYRTTREVEEATRGHQRPGDVFDGRARFSTFEVNLSLSDETPWQRTGLQVPQIRTHAARDPVLGRSWIYRIAQP